MPQEIWENITEPKYMGVTRVLVFCRYPRALSIRGRLSC